LVPGCLVVLAKIVRGTVLCYGLESTLVKMNTQ
jgi:hypothetical protein